MEGTVKLILMGVQHAIVMRRIFMVNIANLFILAIRWSEHVRAENAKKWILMISPAKISKYKSLLISFIYRGTYV